MTAPKDKPNAGKIVLLAGEPVRPEWLHDDRRAKWDEKVAAYRARGLTVRGFEDQLAVYVVTLCDVERDMKRDIPINAAVLTQVRQMGREFYDTPLSTDQGRHGPKGPPSAAANPFAQRGIENRPK